jgi:predicted transcriptional regulator
MNDKSEIVELTAEIVAAYVGNNSVPSAELPLLINNVYRALAAAINGEVSSVRPLAEPQPAVSVKRSIHRDYLVCLEDGKKFKSLRRHLRTHYDLSPEQYREKWNLPADYPMVAPNYAETRSRLAKKIGLGQHRKRV